MKKVKFEGWDNCIEMKSGDFRLIITTDVGPRIIGGFLGKSDNIFNVDPELAGTSGAEDWVNYGGHRLWHSPELRERTYWPDNSPVIAQELDDDGVGFFSPTEDNCGITKSIHIFPLGDNKFRVEHFLRNDNVWDIELAGWSISVMAPGGVAVAPQSKDHDVDGLLPTRFFSVWPYTDMNDPRITWGKDLVMVRQDTKAKGPLKIGFNCEEGWVAYINKGVAFIKKFDHFIDGEYPDNGCSMEIYTNKHMLEAETLSPLYVLAPGDEILHVEEWEVMPTAVTEVDSEQSAEAALTAEAPAKAKASKKAVKKSTKKVAKK